MSTEDQTGVISKPDIKTKKPKLYSIILLNDDFTPRDFVVDLLRTYFAMDDTRASRTMLTAHKQGRATCGVYSKDVAESIVEAVLAVVQEHKFPLLFISEPV